MKGKKRAKKKKKGAPRAKQQWVFGVNALGQPMAVGPAPPPGRIDTRKFERGQIPWSDVGRVRRGPKRRPPSKKSVQTLSRALARRLAVREPGTGGRDVQGVSARVQGVSGAEMVVVRPGSKLYYVRWNGGGEKIQFGMFTSHQRAAGFMDHRDKTQLTLRPWREVFEITWVRVIA